MNKKTFAIIFGIIILCHGATAEAKTYSSLGFAQNGIWYSTDKFLEGDKIKIYSAVFNSSAYDLLGAVEFFDNEISIGKSGFYVGGEGKIKEVGIDWTAVKGQHKISAKIIEAKIRMADGQEEAIILENSQTGVSDIFVEALPPPLPVKEKIVSTLANITNKSAVIATDSITYVLKKTSKLADNGKQIIDEKKTEIEQEIKEIPADSKTMERPLKSSYLLALSAASFIFSNKILFYLLFAAVLYVLIKFSLKIISRNRK
ncbi:MAG: hypothetical protein WC587_00515 [Candidatus Paceibacterota bacterium]